MSLSTVKRHISPVPQDDQRSSAHADLGGQEGSHTESATDVRCDVETGTDAFMLLGDMELDGPTSPRRAVQPSQASKETISIEALTSGIPLEDSLQFAAMTEPALEHAQRENGSPGPKAKSSSGKASPAKEGRSKPRSTKERKPRSEARSTSKARSDSDARSTAEASKPRSTPTRKGRDDSSSTRDARPPMPKPPLPRTRRQQRQAEEMDAIIAAGAAHTASLPSVGPRPTEPKPERAPPGPLTAREEAEAILGGSQRKPGGPLRAEDLEDPGEERTESTEGTLWWWPVVQKPDDDPAEQSGPMHVLRSSTRTRPAEPLRSIVPDEIMPDVEPDPISAETSRTATLLLAACAVVGVVALLWSLT